NIFIKLIENNQQFLDKILNGLYSNGRYLSTLKEAEMDEAEDRNEEAAEKLIQLQKYGAYDYRLNNYLNRILSANKDYYYGMALKYEKGKKWEDARKFYRAILVIDKDNFEANYRLGILCITLQDFNDSLDYLQYALKLKGNDPRVLYQIGVLHFSRGEPKLAIDYLDQALQQNGESASIYLYLGLCNEELGRLQEAKRNYELASIEDEKDINIKSSLERINDKMAEEREKWKPAEQKSQTEVEVGEDMPLPIIDSARKVRLTEEEAVLFEKKEEKDKGGNGTNSGQR
ncbi:MAG: tetratricopeptide repeat protein, partial [Spirochaetes bacterium]|nr:tetratricopeptide repeat protein [Spirochaetota bacterium]